VKLIGDEVMFVAPEADAAADIAIALVDTFVDDDVLPPVRAALATGEVLARDGDYSGAVVNLAARATSVARPSSVLVDEITRTNVTPERFSTRDAGRYSLKGFDSRVRLYRLRRSG
jgi:adenylate cyclase